MKKYGNCIALLDATYKTTKYSIPLFFVAVKTNVKYMVVGSFAIQEETTEAITETMGILRSWNESWNPVCFMVDNCIEEIHCLEHLFPSNHILIHMSHTYLSFFHNIFNDAPGKVISTFKIFPLFHRLKYFIEF